MIRNFGSVFLETKGNFHYEKPRIGLPWSVEFIKYCNRIVNTFPVIKSKDLGSIGDLKERLFYVRKFIQPFLSDAVGALENRNTNSKVSKERLTKLW